MAENIKYGYRFLARIVVEAVTPIAVGAGEKNVISNALVVVDSNGLPYIPGSSLAGVMRHEWEKKHKDDLFGKQDYEDSWGSRIIVSDACLIGAYGKVADGLRYEEKEDVFLQKYRHLPVRQHVRINRMGTSEKAGKFDEQVVFKGSRFCFDLELLSENEDATSFEDILNLLYRANFRVGGSTRHGLGLVRVVNCKRLDLNLNEPTDLDLYLDYSSSLNSEFPGTDFCAEPGENNLLHYQISLLPENFFLFGSGFGDSDADMIPVREDYISLWDENGIPSFCEQCGLIPASSVKGALSHRLAYHWNKLQKKFADTSVFAVWTEENAAVTSMFGSANTENPERGHVFFSDIFLQSDLTDKLLNHVAIDPFTGGAADAMLFSEKTLDGSNLEQYMTLDIWVEGEVFDKDPVKKEAFECALRDLCSGRLPLGGGVNRGHGAFYGKFRLNGNCIFQYQ